MTTLRLELVCHRDDEKAILAALRQAGVHAPIDGESIEVRPLDLTAGSIRERVTGRMPRTRLTVTIEAASWADVEGALDGLHLQHALRWTHTPIDSAGTIE